MQYTITQIEERVYALLDENYGIEKERVDYADPGMPISSLIRELLPDVARVVLSKADLSDIDECERPEGRPEIEFVANDQAVMPLPSGFLRLVNIRMSDWRYGISEPLASGGEEHRLRRFNYTRGSRRRRGQAVAISSHGRDKELEIFGTANGAHVAEFEYLIAPQVEDDAIELPPGCYAGVCEQMTLLVKKVIE